MSKVTAHRLSKSALSITGIALVALGFMSGAAEAQQVVTDPQITQSNALLTGQIAANATATNSIIQAIIGANASEQNYHQLDSSMNMQGYNYTANNAYNLLMQGKTADLAQQFSSAASLAAICQPATMASGLNQATQNAQAAAVAAGGASGSGQASGGGHYNNGGPGSTTALVVTAGTGGDAFKTKADAKTRTEERVNTACDKFGGKYDTGLCAASARPYEDTLPTKFWTDDYLSFPDDTSGTNPDIHDLAVASFYDHLAARFGGPPEPHSNDATFFKTDQGQEAFDNQRTQASFFNLIHMARDNFHGDHVATVTGDVTAAIAKMYTNASLPAPTFANGKASRAQIFAAIFRDPIEKNATAMAASLDPGHALQQIDVEIQFQSYLEYQRYILDQQNQMTLTAILAAVGGQK